MATATEIIREAMAKRKQIAFDYTNRFDEKGTYRIFPLRIETSKKGNKIVVGIYKGGKRERKVRRGEHFGPRPKRGEVMTPSFIIIKMTNTRIATIWDKLFLKGGG